MPRRWTPAMYTVMTRLRTSGRTGGRPRRRPGMLDAGVVTLEEQPDEEHAFGQAAPLVKEWRELRVGGDQMAGRVDQGRAAVRRWELEVEMLRDFRLTLPPETHPHGRRESGGPCSLAAGRPGGGPPGVGPGQADATVEAGADPGIVAEVGVMGRDLPFSGQSYRKCIGFVIYSSFYT